MSSLHPQPGEIFGEEFFNHGVSSYHLPTDLRRDLGLEVPSAGALLPSRNNFDPPSWTQDDKRLYRLARPYVRDCCKGTLALAYEGGQFRFKALACGSWSCPHCRKGLATRTLDRLRRGLEARAGSLSFVTLTLDPAVYGGRVIGYSYWNRDGSAFQGAVSPESLDRLVNQGDVRQANLWSEPTREQFHRAAEDMSREFKRLCDRLNRKARRAGLGVFGYFRVIELHRNGWPHYHVVFKHSHFTAVDIGQQLAGWSLGIVDARDISLDDAVGEVAPYLTSTENKAAGSKGYQFAALALPKNFRLYSSSAGFLADPQPYEGLKVEHALVLRGHFASYRDMLPAGSAQLVLYPPGESPRSSHRPPASFMAVGDEAAVLFAELITVKSLKAPEDWFPGEAQERYLGGLRDRVKAGFLEDPAT